MDGWMDGWMDWTDYNIPNFFSNNIITHFYPKAYFTKVADNKISLRVVTAGLQCI